MIKNKSFHGFQKNCKNENWKNNVLIMPLLENYRSCNFRKSFEKIKQGKKIDKNIDMCMS